jgi:hypothetical protein
VCVRGPGPPRVRHRDAVFDVQMQDSINVGPRVGRLTRDRAGTTLVTAVGGPLVRNTVVNETARPPEGPQAGSR